jgi:tRNA(Ile)-lysidine synthase
MVGGLDRSKNGMSWTLLHARVHQTLRQRKLLKKGQRLLLAVSGGQDSLCLLKLLVDLQPKWQWQLAIAHCDHQWSSDVGIAEHVERVAGQFSLPFYLKKGEAIRETEAAAREWRYQMLVEIAQEKKFSAIATGHTQSDRAETLLYNLIRGAGADGLGALSWQRALTSEIALVRPLLEISRQETGDFCQQFQLSVWSDAVNQNLKYARNRLRESFIPYLKDNFNPQVEKALATTAELLRADVDYLESTARELLQQIGTREPLGLNRRSLQNLPLALQRRILRQFLRQYLPKMPTFEQIEALINLINAPNRSRTAPFGGGSIAEVRDDWILLLDRSKLD